MEKETKTNPVKIIRNKLIMSWKEKPLSEKQNILLSEQLATVRTALRNIQPRPEDLATEHQNRTLKSEALSWLEQAELTLQGDVTTWRNPDILKGTK